MLLPIPAYANSGLQATFWDNQTGQDNQYNDAPPFPPTTNIVASIPVATIDQDFDLNPVTGVPYDDFLVKYEGYITANESGVANLQCLADDGCIVIIDGVTIINEWYDKGTWGEVYQYQLVPNQSLPITVWYYENGGGAVIQLRWQLADRDWAVVPESVFSTAPVITTVVDAPTETHTAVDTSTSIVDSPTVTEPIVLPVLDTPTIVDDSQTATVDSQTSTLQPDETSTVVAETQTLTSESSTQTIPSETSTLPIETPLPTPVPVVEPQPVPVVAEPQPVPQPEPAPAPLPESIPEEPPLEEPPLEETPVVEEQVPVEEPSEHPTEEETNETPTEEQENQAQPEPTPEPSPQPIEEPEPNSQPDIASEPPVVVEPEIVPEAPVEPQIIQMSPNLDLSTLAPETPVELENGVVLTAEVVVALQLLENPAELLGELFTDPGQVLTAISNIGADMSPEVREQSEKVVVSAIIAGGVAVQAAASAAGAAAYRRKP